jgi:hypothetical protein
MLGLTPRADGRWNAKTRPAGQRGRPPVFWDDARLDELRGHVANGETDETIGARYGVTRKAIQNIRGKHRIAHRGQRTEVEWTPEQKEALRLGCIAGAMYEDLAGPCGHTKERCRGAATRYGYTKLRPPGTGRNRGGRQFDAKTAAEARDAKRRTATLAAYRAAEIRPRPQPVRVGEEREAIERWIAENGVTRCPPAAVAYTTHEFDPADREAIRAHEDSNPLSLDASASWAAQREAARRGGLAAARRTR